MFETYLDQDGRRWIRLDESTIWNSDTGYGGFFNGKGLTIEAAP